MPAAVVVGVVMRSEDPALSGTSAAAAAASVAEPATTTTTVAPSLAPPPPPLSATLPSFPTEGEASLLPASTQEQQQQHHPPSLSSAYHTPTADQAVHPAAAAAAPATTTNDFPRTGDGAETPAAELEAVAPLGGDGVASFVAGSAGRGGAGAVGKKAGLLDEEAYELVDRVFNGGLSHALVQTLTVIAELAPALQPEVQVRRTARYGIGGKKCA